MVKIVAISYVSVTVVEFALFSEGKMLKENYILLGKAGDKEIRLLPNMLNRHGLIAGASGTGKTVTLKVIAESLSQMCVSTFIADVKGDLSGMIQELSLIHIFSIQMLKEMWQSMLMVILSQYQSMTKELRSLMISSKKITQQDITLLVY